MSNLKKIIKDARIDKLLAAGALVLGAKVINDNSDKINEPWYTPDAGAQAEEDPAGSEKGVLPGLGEDTEINFDRAEGGVPDGGSDAGADSEEENEEQIAEDDQETRLSLNLGRTNK